MLLFIILYNLCNINVLKYCILFFCIELLLDYLSKFDYFHIQMDFVFLYA
jgi:hypothetical protein